DLQNQFRSELARVRREELGLESLFPILEAMRAHDLTKCSHPKKHARKMCHSCYTKWLKPANVEYAEKKKEHDRQYRAAWRPRNPEKARLESRAGGILWRTPCWSWKECVEEADDLIRLQDGFAAAYVSILTRNRKEEQRRPR